MTEITDPVWVSRRESTTGDLTDALLRECTWSDAMLEGAGIPIVDAPLVSVGGGFGSFALVQFLRIGGMPADSIRVLTTLDWPHETYRYLAEASQIRDPDRLRSDSMSRADNIWGWPSYALTEAIEERSLRPLLTVLTEPILTEFYNPRARILYRGVEREAGRIGWPSMLVKGQVRLVRKRDGGGYFVLLTPPVGSSPTKRVAYRCRFVHLAPGYPSLRFLPDLQEYRTRFEDYHRVVNAYEPHEHVYRSLSAKGGTVIVRGAGIVASRILQKLIDDRDAAGSDIQIIHLLRRTPSTTGGLTFRRHAAHGFTYQPFTFAKAAGGGQLRGAVMRREGNERADFIRSIGGTTTAKRRIWERQLKRARREGFYRLELGEVEKVRPGDGGKVVLTLKDGQALGADFVIDATGIEGDIREHRVLADLLQCGGAGTNPYGRLDVSPHFEVRGTRSGEGRIYASGSVTLGGYLAPVDSFWGVQHAALEISDELARLGFCNRIGVRRSVVGWWRWIRGAAP